MVKGGKWVLLQFVMEMLGSKVTDSDGQMKI